MLENLTQSLLAGLAQENAAPDAGDVGFEARASAITPEDYLLPAGGVGASVAESAAPPKPGFTGEITDSLGRKRRFVNGKPVPIGGDDTATQRPAAKLAGQPVHVIGHDTEHGLVKVQTADGEEKTVKVGDLDMDNEEAPGPSPQAKPAKKKFGKSKAAVSVRMDEAEVADRLAQIFPDMHAEEARQLVASLVGAPDDAEIFLTPSGEGPLSVGVSIKHPDIKTGTRTIGLDDKGNRFIHNDMLLIRKPGGGLGTKIFAQQVENAAENGFAYIETTAGGSGKNYDVATGTFRKNTMSGYAHWPNVGYDKRIDEAYFDDYLMEAIAAEFPDAETIRDLVTSPGGLDWWKRNGDEIQNMTFDLSEGSESREILDNYIAKRGR